ncbi:ABC transporter substrate-binding protein [Parvimonas micra]|uniref:Spermidine/putrescine ABC transporter substrate-binding protein n=1 Tax=Parvimonas micra TaxID=33033 RepID=A0A9X3K727_9FIRM|nr:spermidine/putrescine ABC transporter substrate-binding protein [Parvimonas micra]MCZ7407085.1 spermidine/putrescine ABC transporter substrate-binding protein [Parvimonas micra]MCZ7410838.1 spermidine/putrescine ABC transporter substrate-binding protein [Parvimonas micra]MCZ7411553.1 spermidine/putrescine ABC transporter substrate-binding protein [Parvimonas micra]WBB37463.1 spermidine/putrescine ABC transporter substrate-binding protein [Parvimonas micra]
MTKKNIFLNVLFSFCMIFLLSSCSKREGNVVNMYNWGEYIDKEVLDEFTRETGIKVNYETFVTNEDMYLKIKQGGSNYDIVVPSDYMIEKMIKEDMLEPIDKSKLSNYKNIDAKFLNKSYDPESKYSIPLYWGTLGILYNKNLVDGEITSWADLWNEKHKDKIIMLDSSRDSLAAALLKNGFSMNSRNKEELEIAKKDLIKQKKSILAYLVDEAKDNMLAENAAIAVMYSGDATELLNADEKFEYVKPKEGTNLWFDSMVILKNSKNKENAHKLIDFLIRKDILSKNMNYTYYAVPNQEVINENELVKSVTKIDDEYFKKMEVFKDPSDFLKEYDNIWTDVKAD